MRRPEMKNIMAYNTQESGKHNGLFPTIFGLRSPVIQKPFSPKKGMPYPFRQKKVYLNILSLIINIRRESTRKRSPPTHTHSFGSSPSKNSNLAGKKQIGQSTYLRSCTNPLSHMRKRLTLPLRPRLESVTSRSRAPGKKKSRVYTPSGEQN